MKLTPTPIAGAFLVEIEPSADERGMFARTYCEREFAGHGIHARFVQTNVSVTRRRGTLRGMHLQAPPHEESKLVRCVRGRVHDVMLDLRPGSVTFAKWHAVELDAALRNAVYIPEGCAHGFQALSDESELLYQMSAFYAPDAKRGVRWDDRSFGIAWPMPDALVSEADRSFAPFDPEQWRRAWGGVTPAGHRGPAA